METFTRFVLRHRAWVFGLWIVSLAAGVFAAGQLSGRLSYNFAVPGQEGYETSVKIIKAYGIDPYPAYIPVLTPSDGSPVSEHKADVAAVADALGAIKGLHVIDYASTGDQRFLTADRKSTFLLAYAPPLQSFADPLAATVSATVAKTAAAHQLDVKMTGYQQLSAGGESSSGPSVLVETLVGAGLALLVLIFVFASFLALLPMMIAAVSILSTFLVVLGLTTFTDVSFVVQFLISLVGLGVAIDYSLLVVSRWREERALGASNEDAVVTAMRTAGHAVLASGITVAISLMALIVVPVPLLRSMGVGGMLIPLMSVFVVLTLLPAMLSTIGPRVDWPRIRHEDHASRGWSAWARGVVRFRWVAAGFALAALAVMIAPIFGIQIGVASSDSLASSGVARDGLNILERGGVGSGVLTSIEIFEQGGDPKAFTTAAEKVDGVYAAVANDPGRGGGVDITVIPTKETVDNNSVAVVDDLRDAVKGIPGFGGLAGQGPTVQDYQHAVYGNFPSVLAVIALVTFLLLVRTFRSLLLPIKAVVLNLISMAAVFGLATWFWQQGHGSDAIFGIRETGALTFWVPIIIFAFLFGLSMDYEVFILARTREEYDRTGSTGLAVERGLGRTGRLVTSAALILFFAFSALASAPTTDIKVLATALGVGILLDATLVRALLVPALVSLFGKWNWWLPVPLARVLRVQPSPLTPDVPVADALAAERDGTPVPSAANAPA